MLSTADFVCLRVTWLTARLGSSFHSPSPRFGRSVGRSTCKCQYEESCFFLRGSSSIVELKFHFSVLLRWVFFVCVIVVSCALWKPDCFCLVGFQLDGFNFHFPLQNTQASFATDGVRSKGRLHKQEFNCHRPALYGLVYFSLRHICRKESLHCRNLAYNIIKLLIK